MLFIYSKTGWTDGVIGMAWVGGLCSPTLEYSVNEVRKNYFPIKI